ncbi:hypothetical protein L211DRAFT_840175 [Terfezia boudieri ATCC MYA-4762]|uniref:Uncharacterized protein n=1 Tax=Terfezia boudieri ATCC MYA-4762 TaxID=1051890 RepID=A0A3N4LKS0_9PEZI|nr:hypothetical protein L211DRAFT_840175 [Terfezia boudieri ATCC MYA-4762]
MYTWISSLLIVLGLAVTLPLASFPARRLDIATDQNISRGLAMYTWISSLLIVLGLAVTLPLASFQARINSNLKLCNLIQCTYGPEHSIQGSLSSFLSSPPGGRWLPGNWYV